MLFPLRLIKQRGYLFQRLYDVDVLRAGFLALFAFLAGFGAGAFDEPILAGEAGRRPVCQIIAV